METLDSTSVLSFIKKFEPLPEVLVKELSKYGKTLLVAESCTGGLLAKKITDVPGASDIFIGGVVCYSNEMKSLILKVPQQAIETYGAVSEEVARYMDNGLRSLFPKANFRISITGIAGPGGGSIEKPVGTVYIAIGENENVLVKKLCLSGTRKIIREISSDFAISLILQRLRGMNGMG